MTELFELHPQLKNDSFWLGDFSLTRLLLINDCQYPWFVLVPKRAGVKEIYQLSVTDQTMLWQESNRLSEVIMASFKGDKLNMAAIGNLVPQLHLHHIVRYTKDICWPAPVWGKFPMKPYASVEVKKIQQSLTQLLPELRLRAL